MSKLIACVQMDCELGNPQSNLGRILSRLEEAAGRGASLVIFPECAISGYCFESRDEASRLAESTSGPAVRAIASACARLGVHAIVGFIEQDGPWLFNAAMVVGPSGLVGTYRKVHLPHLGVDRFLDPGNVPFKVFNLPFGKVGINICYDIGFPEAPRALKLLGAELIAIPTNWPRAAWRTPEYILNARAIENHINVAAANRIGVERGWDFIGRSMIVDFNGDTRSEAGAEYDEILLSEIDFEGANQNRIVNVVGSYEVDRIADRRPEFYDDLTGQRSFRARTR